MHARRDPAMQMHHRAHHLVRHMMADRDGQPVGIFLRQRIHPIHRDRLVDRDVEGGPRPDPVIGEDGRRRQIAMHLLRDHLHGDLVERLPPHAPPPVAPAAGSSADQRKARAHPAAEPGAPILKPAHRRGCAAPERAPWRARRRRRRRGAGRVENEFFCIDCPPLDIARCRHSRIAFFIRSVGRLRA